MPKQPRSSQKDAKPSSYAPTEGRTAYNCGMGTQLRIMRVLFVVGFSLGAFGFYAFIEGSQRHDAGLQAIAVFLLAVGAVVAIGSWRIVSKTPDGP